jgi:hypothetical protein
LAHSRTRNRRRDRTLSRQIATSFLDELKDMRSVVTIRTPDSLANDLRYAHQSPAPNGGRQIVLAIDLTIGFCEAVRRPRTIHYPQCLKTDRRGSDVDWRGDSVASLCRGAVRMARTGTAGRDRIPARGEEGAQARSVPQVDRSQPRRLQVCSRSSCWSRCWAAGSIVSTLTSSHFFAKRIEF